MQTDSELLNEYITTNNTQVLEEVVTRHQKMVYNTCLNMLRNPAEAQDAAQATFMSLMKKARSLKNEVTISGWLYKASVYVCKEMIRNELNRKNREERYVMENKKDITVISGRREAQEVIILQENSALVQETIASLPERYRIPLIEHYFEEKSAEEIARELGSSRTAIANRLTRGLEKLRKKLERKGVVGFSTIVLIKYLGISSTEAVPAALTTALSNLVAVGTTTTYITTAATAAITAMEVAKMKIIIASILGAAVIGTGGYQINKITNDKTQITNEEKRIELAANNPTPSQDTPVQPKEAGAKPEEKKTDVPAMIPLPPEILKKVNKVEAIKKKLETFNVQGFDFQNAPIYDVLDHLTAMSGIKFVPIEVPEKTTVTVKVSNIYLDSVLKFILVPKNLTYTVVPDGVWVAPPEKLKNIEMDKATFLYSIPQPQSTDSIEIKANNIIKVIRETMPDVKTIFDSAKENLIITACLSDIVPLSNLILALESRDKIGKKIRPSAEVQENLNKIDQIKKILKTKKIKINFQNTPLVDIINNLAAAGKINVVLSDDIDKYNAATTINVDMSIESILTLLLGPKGLVYAVTPEAIWIGPADKLKTLNQLFPDFMGEEKTDKEPKGEQLPPIKTGEPQKAPW